MQAPEITLRRAVVADAEALSDFAAVVFPLGGRPGADPAHLAAYFAAHLTPGCFREAMADPNLVINLAEAENEIAGYSVLALYSPNPQIDAPAPSEVNRLYVGSAHHGRGVADALMGELLHEAADPVWLSVFSENPRAIRFYERWGFRKVGKQIFKVGDDPQQDFIMQRNQ